MSTRSLCFVSLLAVSNFPRGTVLQGTATSTLQRGSPGVSHPLSRVLEPGTQGGRGETTPSGPLFFLFFGIQRDADMARNTCGSNLESYVALCPYGRSPIIVLNDNGPKYQFDK